MTDNLSEAFAALADPTRRAILAQVAEGPATVSAIVARHRLSQPAISKHLRVLEDAGLVIRGRQGQTRPCMIDPEGLRAAANWIDRYRTLWEDAFGRIDRLIADLTTAEDKNGLQ
jgi:DNA-binding transcriptional ArsR family regulator